MHYDCLIIGLGGIGSSALYHLAKRGVRVCGLEQFEPIHDRGSSHGMHRVFRKAYFEHQDYVPLLQTAERLWLELESESGASLYRRTGVVLSGPDGGDAVAGTLAAAAQHDLPVECLNPDEAHKRWPLLRFRQQDSVVLDPDAGILAVEDCVTQHLDRARQLGAETCFLEPIKSCEVRPNSVTITTDKETRTADSVVFAGGAWSQSLLPSQLPPLQVLHKLQLWHTVEHSYQSQLGQLPAFFFETPQGTFYGMHSGPGELKLARHSGGSPVIDPSNPGDFALVEEQGPCARFASDYLKGISSNPVRTSNCLYTVSPDGHFIVDHSTDSNRIVFAAGLSGHGFKFASALGAVLADLATCGRTDFPIDFLSAKRFQ
jgi:sarcosine oxidase